MAKASIDRDHDAKAQPQLGAPSRSILRGELDNVRLSTLLTILDMERRSGVLLLAHDRQMGRLCVRDGRVTRARINGPRRRPAAEAVYEMLAWTSGQFELWQAEVGGPDEIQEPTTFLLLEGMRRIDEAHRSDTGDASAAFA